MAIHESGDFNTPPRADKNSWKNYTDKAGFLSSVYPPRAYLTFGPWIYMVPQYEPESVLMLGYGAGTTAGLIRKLYGDVKITGVDKTDCPNYYDVELIKADAQEFIKTCDSYDTIIVDLFDNNYYPCKFVLEEEFADSLKEKARYIILHTTDEDDLSEYGDLCHLKTLSLGTSRFNYFMTEEIHALPIR